MVSSGNLLAMQKERLQPRITESESTFFTRAPDHFYALRSSTSTDLQDNTPSFFGYFYILNTFSIYTFFKFPASSFSTFYSISHVFLSPNFSSPYWMFFFYHVSKFSHSSVIKIARNFRVFGIWVILALFWPVLEKFNPLRNSMQ